jgi:hypothetical protein
VFVRIYPIPISLERFTEIRKPSFDSGGTTRHVSLPIKALSKELISGASALIKKNSQV